MGNVNRKLGFGSGLTTASFWLGGNPPNELTMRLQGNKYNARVDFKTNGTFVLDITAA